MIKKKLIIYAFILIVLAVSVCAVTFTDYSLQPSSTSTDFVYWYLDPDNLTLFYNYTDGRLNILQDWSGTIYYNGVANVSLPPSVARYNFDYDINDSEMLNDVTITPENVTTSAGWTDPTHVYDNDWATYGIASGAITRMFFNYSIPKGAHNITWEIKDGLAKVNLSVPGECWNVGCTGYVGFYVSSDVNGGGWSNWTCYNGNNDLNNWVTIRQNNNANAPKIYEESAHWHFNGTVIDSSVAGMHRDGLRSNLSVNHSQECHSGYCYDFDGEDSRIVIPITATDLRMIHGGTISAWIKPLSVGEGNEGRIVDKATGALGYNGYAFSVTDNNRIRFQIDGGTPTRSLIDSVIVGNWYHVAVVFNSTGRILYVDGVNVTASGGWETGLPPDYADEVCIGNRASGWEYTFNGTIDDVRFFNTSLSEEQIRFVYLDMINVSNLAIGDYYMTLNVSLLDSVVNLTSPNTTLRDGTFNITIFEEDTGSSLSGTNATIALRLGDITTDYWTDTGNKTITGLAGGLWTLTVSATGFSYRTYEATLSGSETVDVVAYLVPNSSATVTFNVQNEDNGESIEDAYATMYRNIGEGFEVVESRYTDITGRVLFSYIPNGEYRFLFTKSGFEELLFTLNPIVFSTYNIEMTPETTINQSQDLDRISLVYGPTMFYNIILKNFTFLISSPFGDLLSYGFNLSYPGGSIAFDGSLGL